METRSAVKCYWMLVTRPIFVFRRWMLGIKPAVPVRNAKATVPGHDGSWRGRLDDALTLFFAGLKKR